MSKRTNRLCAFANRVAGLKFCSEHGKCEDCPMFCDEEMLKHEDGRTCNADAYCSGFLDGILISRFGYRRKLRRMMKEQGENFKFYDSPRMFKQREEELTEKAKQHKTPKSYLGKMLDDFKNEHPRGIDEITEVLEQDENVRKKIHNNFRNF